MSASHTASGQRAALRASVARVRTAATAFLQVLPDDVLPLGEFAADELRAATSRMLALLDGTDSARAAVALEVASTVHRAVRALEAIDLREVHGEDLASLASAVAAVHADLAARTEPEVTRALLDASPVGAELAALVFSVEPGALDPDTQVSFCQAAQRLESAAHARLGAGMIAFAGNNPRHTTYWVDGDEHVLTDVRAGELASALTWSGTRARSAMESARMLHNNLEAVAEAAASGSLQPAAVAAIADGAHILTASLDDAIERARTGLREDADPSGEAAQRLWELHAAREELVEHYDRAVAPFASTHTIAETKRKVRDTLAKLDPEGFEARRARARAVQSSVDLRVLPDAMAMLTAVMPSEHATACYRAIDGAARARSDGASGDGIAPIGVRRTDALLAFCLQTASQGAHPGAAQSGSERRCTAHHGTMDSGEDARAVGAVGAVGTVGAAGAAGTADAVGTVDTVDTVGTVGAKGAAGTAHAVGTTGTAGTAGTAWGMHASASEGGTDEEASTATAVARGCVGHRCDLAVNGCESPAGGLAAHVDLVMTLDAFLGLSETAAECVGAGPIPASAARELLADAALVRFRRVLVDGTTGHPLDVGVKRYHLTDAERDRILARDRVCRRPGCNQPASRCECDHAVPYDEGGSSRTDNLGALCTRHHQEKTHGGWRIEDSAADGSCTFVSPLGRRYSHEAERLLPWAEFGGPPDAVPPDRATPT